MIRHTGFKGLGALVLALLAAGEAHAVASCTPAAPVVISIARIEVPANPVVGQALGDPAGYPFESPHGLSCTYTINAIIKYWSFLGVPPGFAYTGQDFGHSGLSMPVYRTGVPGVGFAVMGQDRDTGPMQRVTTGVTVIRGPMHPGLATWGMRGRLFLVVTGAITGGTVPAQPFGMLNLYTNSNPPHTVNFGSIEIGPPRKPTCTVTTPSVPISLGVVDIRAFKDIGSVAGSATRSLVLQCAGGTGANQEVLVTLTDQSQPANRSDRLTLTAASTARGVAVQLLHGSHLIRYGADASTPGNPNQWLAGSTGNGTFEIALTARYVKTHAIVQPGTANGLATFTLSYR